MKWNNDYYDKIINQGNYEEILYRLNEGNLNLNIPPHKKHKTCILNSKKYENDKLNTIINKETFDYYYYNNPVNKNEKNIEYEGINNLDTYKLHRKINKVKTPIKNNNYKIEEEKEYQDIMFEKQKEYYEKMIGEKVLDNIEDLSKEEFKYNKDEENKNEDLYNKNILKNKIKGSFNNPIFPYCKIHSKKPFHVQSQNPKLYIQGTLNPKIIPAGKSTRNAPLNIFE